jgi:hypothetical protein
MQLGGPVRQPYALAGFIPQTGTQNTATDFFLCIGVGVKTVSLKIQRIYAKRLQVYGYGENE